MSLPKKIPVGMILVHTATSQPFRVLCNCPSSTPLHHTQRYVQSHPEEYRHATSEELQSVIKHATVAPSST